LPFDRLSLLLVNFSGSNNSTHIIDPST